MYTVSFLPVKLIHSFASPYQLRQLQYSMVLQLAAAERKKKGLQASDLLAMFIYKSMLRQTTVSAHDYTHIFS